MRALDWNIDCLLRLAEVSTADPAARRWMVEALASAQAIARGEPRPAPTQHNKPLDAIEQAADLLIAAVDELRGHPYAHGNFWRFADFGPAHADHLERANVLSTVKNIRLAARNARMRGTGRPPKVWKQQIVNLALAFCARFSTTRPSSDASNFFPHFAGRFVELVTGSSVEGKGRGIDRQIRSALRRLPVEVERASLLNETRFRQRDFCHSNSAGLRLGCTLDYRSAPHVQGKVQSSED
jgi:hypothetical protein